MKTFNQSFNDIDRLSKSDIKPLGAKLGKLMEEVGELAECVNIHQGFITHKVMKEPLVGEVADVIQNAIAILVDSTPDLSAEERQALLLEWLERKNTKWETVQNGDAARIAAQTQVEERPEETAVPESSPGNIDRRVTAIVAQQLGYARGEIKPADRIVEDLAADSLDLVELVMAIEDEFEFEISDRDAERLFTVANIISYLRGRYGIIDESDDEPTTQSVHSFANKES